MDKIKSDKIKSDRKTRNDELVEKLKSGEYIQATNLMESWYPKRSKTKKIKNPLAMIKPKTEV